MGKEKLLKILVTGSDGLVGSALKSVANSNNDWIFATRKDADLTRQEEVLNLLDVYRPEGVIHLAARVGGIGGNTGKPAEYFRENILMNTHVIHYAYVFGVKKLLAFSSVCAFPKDIPVLKEDLLQAGEPFPDHFSYAAAKRMVDVQICAYKMQYGIENYSSIIPVNIFGKEDLYNLKHGHVIPSLIHKIYLAKKENKPFHVWGDGKSKREFIYSEDLARILLKIIELDNIPDRILVSSGEEHRIREVIEILCEVANFNGEVVWETDKPNGQRSRPADVSVLKSLIGEFDYTDFREALKQSYWWFEDNYEKARQ